MNVEHTCFWWTQTLRSGDQASHNERVLSPSPIKIVHGYAARHVRKKLAIVDKFQSKKIHKGKRNIYNEK